MADFDASAIPQNAGEAQALMDHWSQPEPAERIDPNATPGAADPAQPPPNPKWKLTYRGKEEEYDADKFTQFAQQGRDYSQRMQDFNQKSTAFEQKSKAQEQKWASLEERLNRYSEVEGYIKKDPAWWDHVQKSYQERQLGAAGNGAQPVNDPRLQQLVETVGELQGFVASAKQREAEQERVQEDGALDTQIQEYRTKYPHLDWTTADEKGNDLEKRILDHGIAMGLSKPEHFRIAASDFLFDEHIKRASGEGREGLASQIQKVNKLGLGPITDRPTMPTPKVNNVSSKSWDDISEEAKAAFGMN